MRIVVIGDTHGKIQGAIKALTLIDKFDILVHTGDSSDDGLKLKNYTDAPIYVVKGNCEAGMAPTERFEIIKGVKLFITHGHRYKVKWDYQTLIYKALEIRPNIVLFGHTHVAHWFFEEDILFLNPGSLSLPRGEKGPTFAVIDIANGEIIPRIVEI
jgi:putative phosphoesterase